MKGGEDDVEQMVVGDVLRVWVHWEKHGRS